LSIGEMTPRQFQARLAQPAPVVLVDVREDWELKIAPAPVQFVHIPLGQLGQRWSELNAATETVVICRSGARSMQAASFLARQGFSAVHNLSGGILAWSADLDPSIPVY
jgi:rhodanese-related sulfurtransferase